MKPTLANILTIIRILLTPLFIYLFLLPGWTERFVASVVFTIASITDWYDGYLARRYNQTSKFGQYMDPFADKILVSSALFLFAWLDYIYWWMALVIVVRDLLITFLRSYAMYRHQPMATSRLAKWKTTFQMIFIFTLLVYLNAYPYLSFLPDIRLNLVNQPWLLWTTISLFFVTALTAYSGIKYLIDNQPTIKILLTVRAEKR
jgi:CDP-diacylglycerol--glycerol-3-phosphate 3-phosphatidyltransferase